jgi:hypothetical protein
MITEFETKAEFIIAAEHQGLNITELEQPGGDTYFHIIATKAIGRFVTERVGYFGVANGSDANWGFVADTHEEYIGKDGVRKSPTTYPGKSFDVVIIVDGDYNEDEDESGNAGNEWFWLIDGRLVDRGLWQEEGGTEFYERAVAADECFVEERYTETEFRQYFPMLTPT